MYACAIEEWLTCQKQWMYLESIFSAPDIQRQLPKESKMFEDVDKGWKTIMCGTDEMPNCLRCGTVPGRREKFRLYNNTLDQIQKSLEDYLETKRQLFGRFYFISNDELLAILAQASRHHTKKKACFCIILGFSCFLERHWGGVLTLRPSIIRTMFPCDAVPLRGS